MTIKRDTASTQPPAITEIRPPSTTQTGPIIYTSTDLTPISGLGTQTLLSVSNVGPIPAIFTPASSCVHTTLSTPGAFFVQSIGACWPPVASGVSPLSAFAGAVYYSPAVCPSGWVTASTITDKLYNEAALSASVFACCPSAAPNIGPPPGDTGNCFATVEPGMVLTNVLIADVISSPVVPTSTLSASVINQTSSSTTQSSTGPTNSPQSSTKQSGPGSTAAPGNPPGPPASLSPGAKAGIAIAIVFFCIAIVLVVFVYFRRRGKRAGEALLEKPPRPDIHELVTTANTHEMVAKHNVSEIGGRSKPDSAVVAIDGRDRGDSVRELHPVSHVTTIQSNDLPLSSQELEQSITQPLIGISSQPATQVPNSTETKPGTSDPRADSELTRLERKAELEKEEQKLKVLKERVERIRGEKERLTRIQELETLEEQTKREILDSQKRVGSGSGS